MSEADGLLKDDMVQFYDDPLGFIMYAFPWDTDPTIQLVRLKPEYAMRFGCEYGVDEWACEWLDALGAEVKDRAFDGRNAVDPIQFSTASGHGIGKSTLTALLILWIMSTRPHAKGIVTANTAEQLRTKTWAELGKWWKRCITQHWFNYNSGRGSMSLTHKDDPEDWRVDAQTCREENSESFAGLHAANSTPFYIFDEASAVPDKIFEVREGGTTDGEPMTFDFGNPTRNSGRFFENCIGKFRHNYHTFCIDSRDVAITNKGRLQQWVDDYGEDSDFVKVRVKGVFPSIGVFQFIGTDSVLEAMDRERVVDSASPLVLGVDVARYGDDDSVIYPRLGRNAAWFDPIILKGLDVIQVAGKVIEQVRFFRDLGKPVRAIFVDAGGVGGGVADALKHMGYNPIEVHAQHRPLEKDQYRYRTDEMWGRMKKSIEEGLQLPEKRSLIGSQMLSELTQREYDFTLKGQVSLESKSDMKERGVSSPNIADALALTFYQEINPEIEAEGQTANLRVESAYDPLRPSF